jgi:polar amino acid transport system substrate-binding protein
MKTPESQGEPPAAVRSSVSRRDFLRTATVAGLALPAVDLIAACGGGSSSSSSSNDLLSRLKKAGEINIGLANDPPASIINPDGSVSGEGPVTVQMIMKKLGIAKVKGTVATFGELVPGLQARRWDMIGGVIAMTKARCGVVQYSDPFQYNGLEIAYFPDAVSPAPTSLGDVIKRGLVAGFNSGSAYIQYSQSKGMAADKIVQFQDTSALLDGLATKRIQVIVSDTGSLLLTPEQVQKYPFKHLDYPPDGPFLAGAVAFRPEDKTLYQAFAREFSALKSSGEFDKIAKQFNFPPFPANLKNTTAAEACSKVS